MSIKKLHKILHKTEKHWVGDGFFVSTMFSVHSENYRYLSPFILLDYAETKNFAPSDKKLGVGPHPHRGFETVTFAIQGSIEHRDSSGGGGIIYQDEVQWMTAGSGIVHEEFHSQEFSKTGGPFEMIQLWVNLPAARKFIPAAYQALTADSFGQVDIDIAKVKVIAGEFKNCIGPAKTQTKINIFEFNVYKTGNLNLELEDDTNTILVQINGESQVQTASIPKGSVALFQRGGQTIEIAATQGAKILLLNGAPIDEPVIAQGPFVMNTKAEITQAIQDYQSGNMGSLS